MRCELTSFSVGRAHPRRLKNSLNTKAIEKLYFFGVPDHFGVCPSTLQLTCQRNGNVYRCRWANDEPILLQLQLQKQQDAYVLTYAYGHIGRNAPLRTPEPRARSRRRSRSCFCHSCELHVCQKAAQGLGLGGLSTERLR